MCQQSFNMSPNPLFAIPLIDDTLFIDNSTLEVFTTCPRQAQYYVCQKKEKAGDRAALKFGGIVHKILEARYLGPGGFITPDTTQCMVACAEREFGSYTPPLEDFRNYGTALNLIEAYNTFYPSEPFTVLKSPEGKPFIEVPFACPLGEVEVNSLLTIRHPDGSIKQENVGTVRIMWQGRIDMIVEYEGRTYIFDHKTTSMLGPTYFREFEMSSQFRGYTWAAQHLLNTPIAGAIINAIGVRRPTKSGKSLEFERKTVTASPEVLAEWQLDTLHIITDFIEMVRRQHMPQHTRWCVGKYGLCQFFDVCTLPPDQRQMLLSTGEYKTVTWNPLANQDN